MLLVRRLILILFIFILTGNASINADEPPFLVYMNSEWVNTQMENLSTEEKIAQLIMVAAYSKQDETSKNKIITQIEKYNIGGILIMQGTPVKTANWINDFQEHSKIPMLVAIDGEWGLAMRIDSTIRYPFAQALGAVQDTTYIYQMGHDIGKQLKDVGIHMNLAPVADINTNPQNPVINFRSFGENKKNVAEKTWYLAKGMQDVGVSAVAKHFPGHGDTQTDSHLTLPTLIHSKARMDSVESYPFRHLTQKGINGVMSAHLNVPSLDNSGTPSSLSNKIINGYLKDEIGFSGFVITDALNMQGVRNEGGNEGVEALKAGNDIIEFVPDIEKAIRTIKLAVDSGELSIDEINEKCRKVLALKRWSNLHKYKAAETRNLTARLNSPYYEVTNRKLIKGSLTALKNNHILPVQQLDTQKIASVMIGANEVTPFQKMLGKYTKVDHFYIDKNATERDWFNLHKKLQNYNLVIAGIQKINIYPSNAYGTSITQQLAIADLIEDNTTIAVFFGNAYALKHFVNIHHADGLILAYQNTPLTQELAAQLIFGAFEANGKLPVTVDSRFKLNDGITLKKNDCLSYTIPEEVGINSVDLNKKIDSIAMLGIDSAAYPGCQVLVAKNGNVIFHKCYGYFTYTKKREVRPEDIYDWASLTKVTGPLPALMKLYDEGKFKLDVPFSIYWPDFKGTDKEKISVREVLAHQARLSSWISYWQMALDQHGRLDKKIFKPHPTKKFNIPVSSHLFMNEDFRKVIFDTIRYSKLLPRKKYVYSGLSFYLYPDIISNITQKSYETYITDNFYHPLGAYSIVYNPYRFYPMDNIVPTENDDFFRMENLHGFVHDEGAAMMGGISGNAGLFGTTNDLAKLFQMYLQKGYYGGRRYILEKTITEFTRIQYPGNDNRRGLGFDKPYIDNYKNDLDEAYPAVDASKNSFGHSGYTGTFAWADPDNGLLFIFMSNRVHPTRDNPRLYELNIRPAMHQAIYDCL